MRQLASGVALVCLVAWSAVVPRTQGPPKALTVEGDHFTVDGVPTFLIFVSYFDALRATNGTWATDLAYLSGQGIHGVRIFPTWLNYCSGSSQASDGVIRAAGNVDATSLQRLKDFLGAARSYGMVVNVTFAIDTVAGGITKSEFQTAVAYVAGQITPYQNAIVDVQNEYPNHGFSDGEVGSLISAVHGADGARKAAGSLNGVTTGDAFTVGQRIAGNNHDFAAIHDSRDPTWYQSSVISTLISNLKSGLGTSKPISFQEPNAWYSNPCPGQTGKSSDDSTSAHFTTAVAAAKANGAASWTFHTRLGFELTSASLLSRLNADLTQKATLESLSASQGANWGVSAFSVSPANTNVNELAGSGSLTLTRLSGSTGNWQASSNANWLQLAASQGSGTSLGFSYSANTNTQPRVATITVLDRSVTVTQAAGQTYGAIESPANGATLRRPFVISGWAIDTAAPTGIGVDVVHIYAVANAGSGTAKFLGAAVPSSSRPAVASTFGSQYQNSGYEVSVGALPAGTYQLQAHPLRTATQTFGPPQTSLLTIRQIRTDFDGDGKDDLGVFRSTDSFWSIRLSSTGGPFVGPWGGGMPVPADYDGDGLTDLATYQPTTGTWSVRLSGSGGALWGGVWGVQGDKPVPADYDGDGLADLAVYRPSNGLWQVRLSGSGGALWGGTWWFGTQADIPVPGDYDGDAVTDLAVYRPSDGRWHIRQSASGGALRAEVWWTAVSGDKPVPADYDGDGKTDLAVYRPSDGFWHVQLSGSGGTPFQGTWWTGTSSDIPVPADYDGDGKVDLAAYRPTDGMWNIRPSSNPGVPMTGPWWTGVLGDVPIFRPIAMQ